MELGKKQVMGFAAVLGLLVGFGSATLMNDQSKNPQSYCKNIESKVQQSNNLSGTLACFKPSLINVNLSEQVKENSELKCVCRQEYKGFEQLIPISISNN